MCAKSRAASYMKKENHSRWRNLLWWSRGTRDRWHTTTLWPCCQKLSPFGTRLDNKGKRVPLHFLKKHIIGSCQFGSFWRHSRCMDFSHRTGLTGGLCWVCFFASEFALSMTHILNWPYKRRCNYLWHSRDIEASYHDYGVDLHLKRWDRI